MSSQSPQLDKDHVKFILLSQLFQMMTNLGPHARVLQPLHLCFQMFLQFYNQKYTQ